MCHAGFFVCRLGRAAWRWPDPKAVAVLPAAELREAGAAIGPKPPDIDQAFRRG